MKSWKTPTPEQVDRAVALLVHPEQHRYFFDRLENPKWIGPLKSKGFFRNPPKPQRDEARGTIGFPPWPESRYLARMARLNPELVLEVLLEIPDTDNVRVYEDLADAALNMPPNLAARLVERAKTWARSPYQLLLPEKLGALAAHLARGGEVDNALGLARVLLEVLPDPRADEVSAEDPIAFPPEPKARFDTWDYEQILKKDFPEVVQAAGVQALHLLCDLLETFIRLSCRRSEDESPEDYSWRPAIEDHAQNNPDGPKNLLVSGIRDTVVSLANRKMTSIQELVELLEGRRWRIFHRIALHLLRQSPEAGRDLVAARLTDRALFNDSSMRHEYALLVGERFGILTLEQQQTILSWIEEGPDLQRFKGAQEQYEDAARYRKIWQRDHLAWFKTHLPEDWKRRYEALVAECGEPEHPEFASYTTSWVGPMSPKGVEELQTMTVPDIVEFLKTWKASENHMTPSPEGLGRVLSSVVSQNPERFAREATSFQGLDPTYVRALISGLRDAAKEKRTFPWPPVLDLCRWVVDQPRKILGRHPKTRDADPDWGWTRKAIADLLSVGFEEGSWCIPFEYRSTVWEILHPLTNDPDPTPEHEARYGGSNMDPATLSINTTRGEAMHATVRYALWVRRHLDKQADGKERGAHGFDEMPEVREILDGHLDVSRDPSLAIRAVYGQWFLWLVLLDPDWARTRVTQIFSAGESERTFRDAAWETYIIFCAPYDNVFEVLRDQYAAAVERLGEVTGGRRRLADADEQLVEHLMIFYWRGKLDEDEPNGLLRQLWSRASDKLRGHALSFVGRALHETKDAIPVKVLQRLKKLWENRLAAAKEAPAPDSHKHELAAFGWWFVSGKFDDQWAMTHLAEGLKIAGKADPDHLVVERLAALVQRFPEEAVQCLEAVVRGDREGWSVYGWRDHGRMILAIALQDSKAKTAAEDLIHYLGSRGYSEFRDLLQKK